MNIVVDTNVIVSALINVNGTPAKILSLLLNGKVKLLYDNRIIFEYTEVLLRKEFGFNADVVNDMIEYFKHQGDFINANYFTLKFHDETDKKFYEIYKTGEANYLITGNIKHFPNEKTIITPKDFLEIYDKLTSDTVGN